MFAAFNGNNLGSINTIEEQTCHISIYKCFKTKTTDVNTYLSKLSLFLMKLSSFSLAYSTTSE